MWLALAWLALTPPVGRAQELKQAIASWAEATVGRSSQRWVGQRVAMPEPTARPASGAALDSELWPLRVHLSGALDGARLGLAREVLAEAEQTFALLTASGLFVPRQGSSLGQPVRRDLYLVDGPVQGAARDDSELISDLDGASAFALLSTGTPAVARAACVAEALLEAQLLELDPAEHESVRKASALYFARLVSGDFCADYETPLSLMHDATGVLHEPDKLARWLWALGARQDRNRGLFMQDMWHFSRQRTWEGSGLRGSPDLFEAIAKTIELSHDKLEEIAGELANASALEGLDPSAPQARQVTWSRLPAHLAASAPLAVLDSSYQWIDLEAPRPHERLTIWSRAEFGVRWVLSATRLDASGRSLGTVNAPVHKNPDTELTLELDGETRYVLVSLTNFGNGLPDADLEPRPELARSGRLIIARAAP